MKKIDKTHFNLNDFSCLPDMAVQACNPSPWEVEVEGLEGQSHSWLNSNFKTRQKYIKLSQEINVMQGGDGAHL